jgi:DNA-binding XRE family transcriptional regulator
VWWRVGNGWNAKTLAARAGVAPGTLSGLETGKRVPLRHNVLKILDALGKTEVELIREEADEPPALPRTDPLLADLKPEDLRIARQWSRATLAVKTSVKDMLDADERRTKEALARSDVSDRPFPERRSGIDRRRAVAGNGERPRQVVGE